VGFFPAPHSRRPVYVTAAGEIAVWDEQEKRDIALLDSGGSIMRLAYSPDESMVAVATLQDAGERSAGIYRMRVWRTDDGALVQELRPYEQMAYSVGGLLWSPDGKYVLASTKAFGNFINRDIGIWEVQTGRHRGDLTVCAANVTGLASLAGGRIFEGCGDGTIREWNISEVMTQVSTFIASMTGAQGDGTAK
jgi:WD40 repeat protein